jgi:hypothetical protein
MTFSLVNDLSSLETERFNNLIIGFFVPCQEQNSGKRKHGNLAIFLSNRELVS